MHGIALAPIGVLLLAACLIAMLTRRLGLPYIVGLLVAGFLIALLPNSPELPLSRDLIFNVLLPPLVFEAALQLDWRRFRHELPLTLTLAFLGVAIAAGVVGAGMHWIVGWSWIGAALFGVLIAATDPVSVIASFREMRCLPRVSMVVEAESLLNDGVAAVGFAVISAIAAGASPGVATVIPSFLWSLGGGVIVGLAVSGAILLIVGRTDDPLVEITLTAIAAYGSFLVAENFHASGVISALSAGLLDWKLRQSLPVARGARKGRLCVAVLRLSRQQHRLHPDRQQCRDPAFAPARLWGGRSGDPSRSSQPRGVDLPPRCGLSPVALVPARFIPAHFVLGRAARGSRARPCARGAGKRAGTWSDHPYGVPGRRLLDPGSGPDDAVVDQALAPRPDGPGGDGCSATGRWLVALR